MYIYSIDFSVASPSMARFDIETKEYNFFIFPKNYNDKTSKFSTHRTLEDYNVLLEKKYITKESNIYSEQQILHLRNAELIAHLICENIDFENTLKIGLEGYSFGSTGNTFIELIAYQTILRRKIYGNIDNDKFFILSPATIKKTAGKGNLNKIGMLDAFLKNIDCDKELTKYIKDKTFNKKSVQKPIDDLIDAYWINKTLQ